MSFERTAAAQRFAPPGHFYSLHPRLEELEINYKSIQDSAQQPAGIDLNVPEQLALLERTGTLRPVGLWPVQSSASHRFYPTILGKHDSRFVSDAGGSIWLQKNS